MRLTGSLLLFVLIVPSRPQSNVCTSTAAPQVRGFKLGMSEAQVKARLLVVMWGKADEIGVQEETVSPVQLNDKEAARGIAGLKLEFLDGHLSYIEVTYTNDVKWANAEEFKVRIANLFGLPAVGWEEIPEQRRTFPGVGEVGATGKKLTCPGFIMGVVVNNLTGPTLLLGQAGLRAEKEKRRAALKEQKQRTFKP